MLKVVLETKLVILPSRPKQKKSVKNPRTSVQGNVKFTAIWADISN